MYPGHWSKVAADKPAVIMSSTGEIVTHSELDQRSVQFARALHDAGLRPGDHIALLASNSSRYHDVVWAALRSGLFLTPLNRYLTAQEAVYILDDCDARALIVSADLRDTAEGVLESTTRCVLGLAIGGDVTGYDSYESVTGTASAVPFSEEPRGDFMFYSSGTTGRPKGVRRRTPWGSIADGFLPAASLAAMFGIGPETVYLSPAPLYHSAPLTFTTAVQALGGTTVIMDHFEPVDALASIERYRVDTSQWVPTMFSRMLKLPPEERARYDLSSHRVAIHAAAPCPRDVKEAMLEWWGPIIHEYYGGTENNGLTYCGPQEWLAHPGTVGRAVHGQLHICDERGQELPIGDVGTVYFELPDVAFSYHNDPDQTRSSQHPLHSNWTTLNDIGRVDQDGYLYLTDRATFMIIAGGVNVYPQEVEDCLIMHEKVEDVAVFGVPNPDLGEEVKAVVQVRPGIKTDAELEQELIAYTRERLSRYKCPRSVDFETQLPRLPTGKLYKKALRERYLGSSTTTNV